MAGRFEIYKYTGKDGDFGTHVETLGIKRIDSCVPSVYSDEHLNGETKAADDASDCATYCIYRPDDPDCKAYSFECVFKLVLQEKPDIQISNVRLYPVGPRPKDPSSTTLYIGNSVSYSKPTNSKSMIAVNDIWNYSKEHPFYLTVAGNSGQLLDYRIAETEYNVEWKDYGYGNVMTLNGVRQPIVPVATRQDPNADIVVKFKNRTFMPMSMDFIRFYDPISGTDVTSAVSSTSVENGLSVTTLKVRTNRGANDLMKSYPSGLVYYIPEYDIASGYLVSWVRIPTETETGEYTKMVESIDVEAKCDEHGHVCFFMNGARKPQLTLAPSVIYHFKNRSGSRFPLRFVRDSRVPTVGCSDNVVVGGITVLNGGTDDEEVIVDPEIVIKHGECITSYQSLCEVGMGNTVFVHPICLVGNYNICRPNGSIYNPMLAGETDYVYLQLEVDGRSAPGYCVPDIKIEYDEN